MRRRAAVSFAPPTEAKGQPIDLTPRGERHLARIMAACRAGLSAVLTKRVVAPGSAASTVTVTASRHEWQLPC